MAVKTGTSVVQCSFMYDYELDLAKELGTSWYRSKDKDFENPFSAYMMNKKWTLEEEFNNHMLRFQQVPVIHFAQLSINYKSTFQAGLVGTEVGVEDKIRDDELEPLGMEHFYFPLGLWLTGLLVSASFLLAEIFSHRIKKIQEGPMATVNQSDIEDTHN